MFIPQWYSFPHPEIMMCFGWIARIFGRISLELTRWLCLGHWAWSKTGTSSQKCLPIIRSRMPLAMWIADYDFLCDFNLVRFHGLLCASSFPSFPNAPGLSGVLFRDFAETDRFEPDWSLPGLEKQGKIWKGFCAMIWPTVESGSEMLSLWHHVGRWGAGTWNHIAVDWRHERSNSFTERSSRLNAKSTNCMLLTHLGSSRHLKIWKGMAYLLSSIIQQPERILSHWLVVWNHFYFPYIYGNVIIPTDFNSIIFQRGGSTTNQYRYITVYHVISHYILLFRH